MSYGEFSPCDCPKHRGLYVHKVWACERCGATASSGGCWPRHSRFSWTWMCRSQLALLRKKLATDRKEN